ncbi:MAG: type II toxin-antitoxin system VapC family toxin [Acidobacteria bacterium]|nr:type II toxin-antitoxin system VapC family toxin [Acidobacteriota bacterium]MCI0625611.1 type II toxin-antitoxin system VapC family toxin [Acidobacteriota bacterium]MCI0721354.1 type II toxin-antitoxin system VapC family toxin [Acidobacteriota bacterium]
MKFLIDTECWLWWFLEPERLNKKAADLIASRDHAIYLSAGSSWEISIKCRLRKLVLPEEPARYVPSRLHQEGMLSLPIEHVHALRVYSLPNHHRDPFDRMLIAQAQCESLPILTADRQFKQYDVKILWASRRFG